MLDINDKIVKTLESSGLPVFFIVKPDHYECDNFITFNFSSYPTDYANDSYHAEEVVYSYVVSMKKNQLKEIMKIARQLQKVTHSEKCYHIYDQDTESYQACYESRFIHYEGE